MANKIKAINAYRPRLSMGRLVEMPQVEPFVALRSGLSPAGISQVVKELQEAVLFFTRDGRSIRIPGIARITPKISIDGNISYTAVVDSYLSKRINIKGSYLGEVINRDNIGKTIEELIALWNTDHPDDPVVE